MQLKKKGLRVLFAVALCSSFLSSNVHALNDTYVRSIEDDALQAVSYLSLFAHAHAAYLEKGNVEPMVRCARCGTKLLNMGEFEGGLVGKALKDLAHFKEIQFFFDEYIKIVSEGVCVDIRNCMVRISNDTQQACSHCGMAGCWQADD